jgi:hypothetical protein
MKICLEWFRAAKNGSISRANCNITAKLKCKQIIMAHNHSSENLLIKAISWKKNGSNFLTTLKACC